MSQPGGPGEDSMLAEPLPLPCGQDRGLDPFVPGTCVRDFNPGDGQRSGRSHFPMTWTEGPIHCHTCGPAEVTRDFPGIYGCNRAGQRHLYVESEHGLLFR